MELSPENKDKNWELYEKLPQELKEALLSPETAESVGNVCDKNDVEESWKVSELVGNVLLGLLSPTELEKNIEKELNIDKESAKKISEEINRYVFFPVKASLEEVYRKPEERIVEEKETPMIKKINTEIEEKPTPPIKKDGYREMVE